MGRLGLGFKVEDKVRAVISGEGDLLSRPESPACSRKDPLVLDTIAFGKLSPQITPKINGHDINEHDLDRPTQGFSSIAEAIEDIRQGKVNPKIHGSVHYYPFPSLYEN